MSDETRILWLPTSAYESRAVFDYESNSFLGGSNRNPAGVRVDANTALNSTVVLACVRVLAEGLATLPLHIYARTEGGGKEVARAHPLYKVLHDTPNEWQTSFEWREMQMLHLGIYGQSFNEIVRNPNSNVIQSLTPLHPSRMLVERVETGRLRYTYTEEDGHVTPYSQDDIMHIRWMSNDGVQGMVPIELARDAIGLARACEIHGASFFANGARPGMVLSTDSTLSLETAEKLRVNWERVHRGPDRASATAVLTGGLKPVEFGNTNQESQFLETRRFQIEEICRLYRVPGSLVGDLSRSNFANIEQQSIDFVQHTLLPWLRRFESAFSRDLLAGDDKHFAEFDTRGLMRGDAAARASYYNTLWNLGVASVNELRSWENLNPVEGGDARFAPLNMQTLENASKPQEQPPAPPAASVSELVAVLGQVASGAVAPESATAIMAAAFPALPQDLAAKMLAGVAAPKGDAAAAAGGKPTADIGGLVAVLSNVREGVLKPEAAVAALGSVYPDLPADTAQQIVAGVNQPPQAPVPAQPAADVSGLLAILAQVGQGAVTPEAALSIVQAVFPSMPVDMARAIIGGVKAQQQPQQPPPTGEGLQPPAGAGQSPASRAFCPGSSPPDNSCSPANKGSGDKETAYAALPKSFPAGTRKYRDAIDAAAEDPDGIWDRAKGLAETPSAEAVGVIADEQTSQAGRPLTQDAEQAYASLIDEVGRQYEALTSSGLKVRAWRGEGEPYGDPPGSTRPNSDRMRQQVAETGEYAFFMTERGFGEGDATPDHPMLRETKYRTADGEPMIANDLFRVVHDMVAHVRGGYSFSTNGEFNGMLTHASTMPESAWPALFAETFGQNAVYERTKGFAQQNAYASKIGPQLIRDELDKRRSTSFRSDGQADSDEPMGYQHIKARPWLLAELEQRAFCPGASPPDNSCSPSNKGDGSARPAASPLTDADRASQSIKEIEVYRGRRILEVTRSEITNSEYLKEVEQDAANKGLAVTLDKAAALQADDNGVNDFWAPYDLFTSNAWSYFTDTGADGGGDGTIIDERGGDYGAISNSEIEQLVEDSLSDQWSSLVDGWATTPQESEQTIRAELGDDYLEAFDLDPATNTFKDLDNDQREELFAQWSEDNRDVAEEAARERQNEARDEAAARMRQELETKLAGTELDCCVQLYRGMTLPEDVIDDIIQEGVIRHTAANSWTTSKSVASGFGADDVLLVCRNPAVGYVRSSDHASEKEITRPPSEMRVVGVVRTNGGVVLHVEEDERYGRKPVRDTLATSRSFAQRDSGQEADHGS